MLGVFCGKEVMTDEAYKKCLKRKVGIHAVLFILGVLTILVMYLGRSAWQATIPDYMLGFYEGIGAGLIFVSIILAVKNSRILKSEKLLHEARISNTDERNLDISQRASRVAMTVMFVSMYLVMIVGGLWYPILTKVISGLVCLFLVIYVIAWKIIAKNM